MVLVVPVPVVPVVSGTGICGTSTIGTSGTSGTGTTSTTGTRAITVHVTITSKPRSLKEPKHKKNQCFNWLKRLKNSKMKYCNYCDYSTNKKSNMDRHILRCHGLSPKNSKENIRKISHITTTEYDGTKSFANSVHNDRGFIDIRLKENFKLFVDFEFAPQSVVQNAKKQGKMWCSYNIKVGVKSVVWGKS